MKFFVILSILVIITQTASAGGLSNAAIEYYNDLDENVGLNENNSNLKDELGMLSSDIKDMNTSISELNVKINITAENITLVKRKIDAMDANIVQQSDKKDKLEKHSDNVFSILGGIPWFLTGFWISIAIFLIWRRN